MRGSTSTSWYIVVQRRVGISRRRSPVRRAWDLVAQSPAFCAHERGVRRHREMLARVSAGADAVMRLVRSSRAWPAGAMSRFPASRFGDPASRSRGDAARSVGTSSGRGGALACVCGQRVRGVRSKRSAPAPPHEGGTLAQQRRLPSQIFRQRTNRADWTISGRYAGPRRTCSHTQSDHPGHAR
jgi:hypothetical protein